MVKRGPSKSMKKRVMELMKKKKLTIKDKKFLAKIQKGGRTWGEWFSSFSSSTPAATANGQNPEAVAAPGSDDHSDINTKLASLEEKVCKVCEKTGTDCGCAGGPVVGTEGEESIDQAPGDTTGQEGEMASQNVEGPGVGEGPGVERRGGRKSKKNKRRRHRKSAKKMSNLLY